jgi:hypothetical protein
MADPDNIGKWATAPLYEPWPPEWLTEFKQKVDTLAKFLIASLELVNVMLDVIKAFLIGINDPISALIKALVKEIKKILKDLQQIGLYFTSDRKLMQYPFKDILGGYQGAEKRMIGRLTDRTDIGRPDVSANTLMIGAMFYVSADTNSIYNLVETINKLLALFSFDISGGAFAPVQNLVATYTAKDPTYKPTFGKDVFSTPKNIDVSWQQSTTLNVSGINIPLPVGAENFIVEVSTIPDGLPIYITRQDSLKASPGGANGEGKPQLKLYPLHIKEDGAEIPFRLFGGTDRLIYTDQFNYELVTDQDGKLNSGGAFIHTFLKDNPAQPIPIHLLIDDSGSDPVYFLQKTFIHKPFFPGNYNLKIPLKELPKAIKVTGTGSDLKIEEDTDNVPTTYYFRVTPCGSLATNPYSAYNVPAYFIYSGSNAGRVLENKVPMGKPSTPYQLIVPRDTTALYQASIESALLCLFLSRPDLDTEARKTPFLDEDKQKIRGLLGIEPEKFFEKEMAVADFHKFLRELVKSKTYEIMSKSGILSQQVEQFVVDSSKELREFTWRNFKQTLPDMTLRECFGLVGDAIDTDDGGVCPNAKSLILGSLELEPIVRENIIVSSDDPLPAPIPAVFPIAIPLEEYTKQLSLNTAFASSSISKPGGWEDAQSEMADYLTNAIRKGEDNQPFTSVIDGLESVFLADKNTYFQAIKRTANRVLPKGGSPLIYSELDGLKAFWSSGGTSSSNPLYFTRDALIDYNNGLLLTQAAFVLNIATSSLDKRSESDWDFVRLGDNGLILFVEQFMNTILNAVEAIMQGLQGIIDAILKFIDFIQQRINEVQNLIRRINALIQAIGLFEIPSVSMLLFASNGTDGVLRDLISAEDKPSDPNTAYGFGALALMPIPLANVVVDLFFPDTDINDLTNQVVEIIE